MAVHRVYHHFMISIKHFIAQWYNYFGSCKCSDKVLLKLWIPP